MGNLGLSHFEDLNHFLQRCDAVQARIFDAIYVKTHVECAETAPELIVKCYILRKQFEASH